MSGDRSRAIKCFSIIGLSLFAYLLYLPTRTGLRAKTDEYRNLTGAIDILQTGEFNGGYISGHIYELLAGILLRVFALNVPATDWISPLISAIPIFVISLVGGALIKQNKIDNWWVIFLYPLGILAVPEIFDGVRESSHKAFTYAISFLCLLIFYRVSNSSDGRYVLLAVILSLTLVLLNYPWGGVYLTITAISFIILNYSYRSFMRHSWLLLILVTTVTVVVYLPDIGYRHVILYIPSIVGGVVDVLLGNFAGSTPSPGSSEGLISLISEYHTITIAGIGINSWFIYSSGVFVTAILCMVSAIYATADVLSPFDTQKPHPLSILLMVTSVGYGFLLIAAVVSGTSVIVKRMVVWPVITGIYYWTVLVGSPTLATGWIARHRSQIAAISIALLLISVPLAAERYAPTRSDAAHHPHLSVEEEELAAFANEYIVSDVELSTGRTTVSNAIQKYYGKEVHSKPCRWDRNVIYSSKQGSCESQLQFH